MRFDKKFARKVVFPLITDTGLEKIFRKFSDHSVLNIMFHGVVKNDFKNFSPRHIPLNQFEKILQYLTKEFDIISLDEAFNLYRNRIKPKRKSINITFDDGYRNNLINALPILEKYDAQATFFISTIVLENNLEPILWADDIACLKYYNKNAIIQIENMRFQNFVDDMTGLSLVDYLKSQDASKRDQILNNLVHEFDLRKKIKDIPSEQWSLLSKDEIIELSNSKIVKIGSHGHLHYNLSNLSAVDAFNDMKKSKDLLEKVIDKQVDSLAYPDGSYNSPLKDMAMEIGFTKQLAVNYIDKMDNNDPRILNRHGISSTTTYESNVVTLNLAFRSKGYN
ncbi:MAG: polysaccharide deacetylase family protein [Bacteroidales bacterium]|nr:polysaccharide deacetylase family protein [Lentimicrobiaceae bacterium]MDD5693713.1 polysaccharide deacetylase family protein [Bacteroidales bacterium]